MTSRSRRQSAWNPVTRGLHVGFGASSRDRVDEFWRVATGAGYRDDGEPGPRTEYGDDYYGGFVLDPDGNSIEAVHFEDVRRGVDHLWIRVADVQASKRFYETIAPHARFGVTTETPERVQFTGDGPGSFSVLSGDHVTEALHMAFAASDDQAVDDFHQAATEAGYRDNGQPGERPPTTRATTAPTRWTPTGTTSSSSTTTARRAGRDSSHPSRRGWRRTP